MNKLEVINTDYLRPSRTIETTLVSDSKSIKIFYVYNYEDYSFRVFTSLLSLISFFQDDIVESNYHFDTEKQMELFLTGIDLEKL